MTEISLLVCTRNRGVSLSRTLDLITRAASAAAHVALEVVIVDNGSTDDTADRLKNWAGTQQFPVVCVAEPRAGLSRARNAGLERTQGRIVAMTDDDCVLHTGYLAALAERFAAVDRLAVIGGRILPGDPADLPVTIKLEDHPMTAPRGAFPGGFVMGANLAFTRDVLTAVGPFDERFGGGARFVSAEDTDFLFRALGHGISVDYDPSFVVDHHHGRRRPADVVALLAGYGFGDGALYAKHILTDRRILAAIREDLRLMLTDVRTSARPFPYIRHFHVFRARQKLQGFAAYALASLRRPGRGTTRLPAR